MQTHHHTPTSGSISKVFSALNVLMVALLLALATACGGGDTSSGSASDGAHNDADVAFATDMIPHHSQAVEMADMALTQASRREVVDLAQQIKAAQGPEIDTMKGWLESWGEEVPDEDMGSMPGMDHGSDDATMPGMMTDEEMQRLGDAAGTDFDQLWLTMMIEHHQGAIEMAQTELADGENADVKALAQDIIDAQEAEIATMQGLLGKDGS